MSLQSSATSRRLTETFSLYPLRFRPVAERKSKWTANTLRGAFGAALRRLDAEAYARYFAPQSSVGPSGLATPPRPFVFRLREEEVGLHLFAVDGPTLDVFCRVMHELGFEQVEAPALLCLPLGPPAKRVTKLRVQFVTLTELEKDTHEERIEFGILARRVRDRISTLRALYGSGPLEIDFKAFGEAADTVRLTHSELTRVSEERVSKATGQRHPLGGFTGFAEYEGDLMMFVPYLEVARYTGVGRQTVWGKGEISVEEV